MDKLSLEKVSGTLLLEEALRLHVNVTQRIHGFQSLLWAITYKTRAADITIIKTMQKPSAGIKLVMEAVRFMRDIKPDIAADNSTGSHSTKQIGF